MRFKCPRCHRDFRVPKSLRWSYAEQLVHFDPRPWFKRMALGAGLILLLGSLATWFGLVSTQGDLRAELSARRGRIAGLEGQLAGQEGGGHREGGMPPSVENSPLPREEHVDLREQREQASAQPAQPQPASPTAVDLRHIRLPKDFAFTSITRWRDEPVDLMMVLPPPWHLKVQAGGDEVIFDAGRDSLRGLRGKGLTIVQPRGHKLISGGMELLDRRPAQNQAGTRARSRSTARGKAGATNDGPEFIWTPEPVACYRDGQLLGIWDPAINRLRSAKSGEAEKVIKKPDLETLANRRPATPPSVVSESNRRSGRRPRSPALELPEDYAFLPLTKADRPFDLNLVMPRGSVIEFRGGREVFIEARRDSVRGLRGKGLTIEQKNEGSVLDGSFRVHPIWTPERIACYRDGQLLGIWDPEIKILRPAKSGEADQEIKSLDTEISRNRRRAIPQSTRNSSRPPSARRPSRSAHHLAYEIIERKKIGVVPSIKVRVPMEGGVKPTERQLRDLLPEICPGPSPSGTLLSFVIEFYLPETEATGRPWIVASRKRRGTIKLELSGAGSSDRRDSGTD